MRRLADELEITGVRAGTVDRRAQQEPLVDGRHVEDHLDRLVEQLDLIAGLDTGKRGGPEPEDITLESFGREIPEA